MNLQLIVAQIYSIVLLMMGLSLLIAPNSWSSFVRERSGKDCGMLMYGLTILPFALFLLINHQIWVLHPIVFITISGWMMFFESSFYILMPYQSQKFWLAAEPGLARWNIPFALCLIIPAAVMIYFTFFNVAEYYTLTEVKFGSLFHMVVK